VSYLVTVTVTAEPDAVWARLADIAAWPDWNPTCVSAEAPDDLASGSTVRLQLRLPRGRTFWTAPRIRAFDHGESLGWETRALGLRAPTRIQLEPDATGTCVTLSSESRGPFGFAYRLTFPEKTQAQLWSGALTGLAQSFRGRSDAAGTPNRATLSGDEDAS
jgi:uncharacterized protein YndB with AHSA1/START domain